MMKAFIGSKIVRAKPMGENDYLRDVKGVKDVLATHGKNGYLVQYPDGYLSWSPKEVFEESYRQYQGEKNLLFKGMKDKGEKMMKKCNGNHAIVVEREGIVRETMCEDENCFDENVQCVLDQIEAEREGL